MPLPFPSLSHGEIVFGFFNIETDMLLLNHYFFFASDFCRSVSEMSLSAPMGRYSSDWNIYVLEEQQIGNLMDAIRGIDLRGFMGDVYARYPFPKNMIDFKQNPDGYLTGREIETIISKYGRRETIPCCLDVSGNWANIGDCRFSRSQFHALIRYVWDGGYPRWKAGRRPGYVDTMAKNITLSKCAIFSGLGELI